MTLLPIWGWGWADSDNLTREPPAAFEVRLQTAGSSEWRGRVATNSHEFLDMVVVLSPRHVKWDGYVNVAVLKSDPDKQVATGFAKVSGYETFVLPAA